MDTAEIATYFTEQAKIRSVTPEEYIAALDRLTPGDQMLFDILDKAKYLQINQKDLENSVSNLRVYKEFSRRTGESNDRKQNVTPAEEIILNIALKFHRISLDSLVGQRLLRTHMPSTADLVEVDNYLARHLSRLLESAKDLDYAPRPRLLDLPLVRELSYLLWYRFESPITSHRPGLVDLASSVYDPQNYQRRLFWRLGPLLSINWIGTHLRLASAIYALLSVPSYGMTVYNSAQVVRQVATKIQAMASKPEVKRELQLHYKSNVSQSYLIIIRDAQRQLDTNSNLTQQEIADLKEKIEFFTIKLSENETQTTGGT